MEIAPGVVVGTVFFLQAFHQLSQALAFIGHYVGQQQSIEKAIALRQVALDADSAGLLSADEDLALQHQVTDVFESNAALDQFAAMLCGYAIQHAGGVEGANYVSGPVIVPGEQPLEQNGINFVGIYKAAI